MSLRECQSSFRCGEALALFFLSHSFGKMRNRTQSHFKTWHQGIWYSAVPFKHNSCSLAPKEVNLRTGSFMRSRKLGRYSMPRVTACSAPGCAQDHRGTDHTMLCAECVLSLKLQR